MRLSRRLERHGHRHLSAACGSRSVGASTGCGGHAWYRRVSWTGYSVAPLPVEAWRKTLGRWAGRRRGHSREAEGLRVPTLQDASSPTPPSSSAHEASPTDSPREHPPYGRPKISSTSLRQTAELTFSTAGATTRSCTTCLTSQPIRGSAGISKPASWARRKLELVILSATMSMVSAVAWTFV